MNFEINKSSNKLYFAKELERRTELFGDNIIDLCKLVKRDIICAEIVRQLIRAACSVGANYIEANESLSKKDFYHRCRICKKEAKESGFWLRKLIRANPQLREETEPLLNESREFILIFAKIVSHAN